MSKNLIVFVDAFPYEGLKYAEYLSSFKQKARVIPGIGFSINVKAEIFGGYKPDDAGFFCEWMYDPHSPLKKWRPVFSLIYNFSRFNYITDRITHKLLSKILKENIFNIPFDVLRYFKKSGTNAYEDEFHLPTILSTKDFKKILYSNYPSSRARDKLILIDAKKIIKKDIFENLFIALADLDHFTHRRGVGSPEHIDKIKWLDHELKNLCDQFLEKNPDGNIIILSDHGMANVEKAVKIELKKQFGKIGEDSYIPFIDSTMLRIWIFRESLYKKIEEYLSTYGHGVVLNRNERKKSGISSKKFGDIIFLLEEGKVFIPSYFGKNVPKAMHGYHPELRSQQGMIVCNNFLLEKSKYRTHELFNIPLIYS